MQGKWINERKEGRENREGKTGRGANVKCKASTKGRKRERKRGR